MRVVQKLWQTGLMLLVMAPVLSLAEEGLSSQEMLVKARPSIVAVEARDARTAEKHSGTGVVVRPHQVATACALVANADGLHVVSDGHSYAATLTVADQSRDLCLLTAPELNAPPVVRAGVRAFSLQDKVWAVGMTDGALFVEPGMIIQVRGESPEMVETTINDTPATVGRGIFDLAGGCIGITTVFHDGGKTLYYTAPIQWVDQLQPVAPPADKDSLVWLKRSMILENAASWPALKDLCQQWVKALPGDTSALQMLGYANIANKDLPAALTAFQELVRLQPENADALSNLGYVYTELAQYPEAIKTYRTLLDKHPDDVESWANLSLTYAVSGNQAEAVKAMREVQRLDPDKAAEIMQEIQGEEDGADQREPGPGPAPQL